MMSFAGKWVELEIIVLREISQTQQIPCFCSYTASRLVIIIGARGHGKETAHVTTPLLGQSFYCQREHKEYPETSGGVRAKRKKADWTWLELSARKARENSEGS